MKLKPSGRKILFFLALCLFCILSVYPQTKDKKTRILFVFDASNSMKNLYNGKPRIEHAKSLFYRFIDSMASFKNYEFALRMYGDQVKYPPGDCNDSRLVVPFSKGNIPQIKAKVSQAKPTGITPIEHSLVMAANDFPDANAVNMIILITDGIEECKGDPCVARAKLLEKGIVFKPCIIGIGLTVEQAKTFDCVGNYFSYEDQNAFSSAVDYITNQQLNKTTAQVNLLDISNKPTETNVNMTFYDKLTGESVYNYIHSINRGFPDTITIDMSRKYDIVAHTIPPVGIKDVNFNYGIHNIIPIDAPQGYLELKRSAGIYNANEKVKCIIRKSGNSNILHVMNINALEKFIVGEYDIEILTLPRTYFSAVKINQTLTKSLDIADAGLVKISLPEPGDGCILQDVKGELKWVCNLQSNLLKQEYNLQPGLYRITYRAKSLKQSIYTVEKKLTVKSNEQIQINMSGN